MATIMVTGGCGFIGSNFIRHLLTHDSSVNILNYDALTYAGNLANLADLADHPRLRFVKGDITDRDRVRETLADGADAIIHFAAESHVDRSIMDSTPFVRTNVLGTQVLLDAAREFGISRFIHISTDEVYGTLGSQGHFTEETPLAPNSPYAASKASSDFLVRATFHTHGFPAIVTRCSNNFGPFQFPEKLIPLFVWNLMNDQPVPVYGDGQQVRDWIFVRDHCAAIEAVWRHGQVGEVYNIGGRCEMTNLELTHMLLNILAKPKSLIRHVEDRIGHDRRYAIDCTKIERELGWSATTPFEKGLRETVAWYLAHRDWTESITSGEYRTFYEKQYKHRL